jgi:hypothetical protein
VNRGATINAVSIKGIEKIQLALTEGLLNVYTRLGRPEGDIKSATFWLMMDNIVQVWSKVFPYEVKEFAKTVKEQRKNERSVSESVRSGLCQQYAIPSNLYKMIKAFYPNLSMTSKEFTKKITDRYPFLKTTDNKL